MSDGGGKWSPQNLMATSTILVDLGDFGLLIVMPLLTFVQNALKLIYLTIVSDFFFRLSPYSGYESECASHR
jgi:hypothetical protein